MTIEEIYAIPLNGAGWRVLPNGNWVKLGNGVKLGNEVKLGDEVTLTKTPLAVQGSRHLATHAQPGILQIGCLVLPLAEWQARYAEIGKENGYPEEEIAEYARIIEFIATNAITK